MASKSGRAGVSTRALAEHRRLIRAGFGIVALVMSWVFFKLLPHAQAGGIGALGVLFFVFKAVMNPLESQIDTKIAEEKQAIRGAVAEEKMEMILDQLGDEHLVLHDIRCEFGNIDHIVLSKRHGVFLIETKAHGGKVAVVDSTIRVNGKPPEKNFISQTLRNTYWLAEQLQKLTGIKPWVSSFIVFTTGFVERSPRIKGITITNKKFLVQNMRGVRKSMSPEIWNARIRIADALKPKKEV